MNVPETFFSVREELVLFGLSCLCGAVLGAVYDIFRALRLIFPHNMLLTAAEDVLFMGIWAVFLSGFAAWAARGELRVYFFIGNVLGFIVYFFTLGTFVIATLRKLFTIAAGGARLVFSPVKRLFVLLSKKAKANFVGYSKVIVNNIKKTKLLLPNKRFLMYNKKENKKRKNVKNVAEKNTKKSKR